MATREGFLRSIVETPDDDAPRLVFADWLDDNGEPERAEFIRVQCELARGINDGDRFVKFTLRERDLISKHSRNWLGPLYQSNRPARFERGMACLEFSAGQFLGKSFQKQAAAWFSQSGVTGLTLCEQSKRVAELFTSPILSNLSSLRIRNTRLGDDGMRLLAKSPHLSQLRELHLEEVPFSEAGLTTVLESPHLGCLTRLQLGRGSAHSRLEEYTGFAKTAGWQRLRSLTLDFTGINFSDADLHSLLTCAPLSRLTELSFLYAQFGDESCAALRTTSNMAHLQRLRVQNGSVTPDLACTIVRSKGLPALEEVDLNWNNLSDAGVTALAGVPELSRLTGLKLGMNGISDAGLRTLVASPYLTGLRELDLSNNPRLTEQGILALAEASTLAGLRVLNLNYNQLALTLEAIRSLIDSPHFPQLVLLKLRHSSLNDAARVVLRADSGSRFFLDL